MRFIHVIYDHIMRHIHGFVNVMFFYKLCADIYRYMAENSEPGNQLYQYKKDKESTDLENEEKDKGKNIEK